VLHSRLCMNRKQASVVFQVVPQPLTLTSMSRQEISNNIAAAARGTVSSNSLRRQSSLPLKRDSAVSLDQAGSRSDVPPLSMRRSFSSSEAAFIEDDLAAFLAEPPGTMGPVYRLVCWLSIVPFSALPFLLLLLPPLFRPFRQRDDNDAYTPSRVSTYVDYCR
jgi:hypothetical protein